MYNQSIRIDKKNGEYEYKICGKWYVSNWIESEKLKKEYSYIPKINGFRKVENEYSSFITSSLNIGQVNLCPGESKNIDVGLHENFKVTKVEILKTGLFNF